jgi:predicted CXXCH cytochrome family protein
MTCLSCHNPHGTQFVALLIDSPSRALCIQCHKDQPEDEKRKSKTAAPISAKDEQK